MSTQTSDPPQSSPSPVDTPTRGRFLRATLASIASGYLALKALVSPERAWGYEICSQVDYVPIGYQCDGTWWWLWWRRVDHFFPSVKCGFTVEREGLCTPDEQGPTPC